MEMGAARYLKTAPRAFDIVFMTHPSAKTRCRICRTSRCGRLVSNAAGDLENEKSAGCRACRRIGSCSISKSAGEVGYHLARISTAGLKPMNKRTASTREPSIRSPTGIRPGAARRHHFRPAGGAIAANPTRRRCSPWRERVEMARRVLADVSNVEVRAMQD